MRDLQDAYLPGLLNKVTEQLEALRYLASDYG